MEKINIDLYGGKGIFEGKEIEKGYTSRSTKNYSFKEKYKKER